MKQISLNQRLVKVLAILWGEKRDVEEKKRSTINFQEDVLFRFKMLRIKKTGNNCVRLSQRKDTLSEMVKSGVSGMFSWGKLNAYYTEIYASDKNVYTEISGTYYTTLHVISRDIRYVKTFK